MPLPLQKKTLKPDSFIRSAPGYTSELHTECPLPNEKLRNWAGVLCSGSRAFLEAKDWVKIPSQNDFHSKFSSHKISTE